MKNKVLSAIFILMLCVGFVLLIALPDEAVSKSERRTLRQFPAFSASTVFEGSFMKQLEEYLLDQFPGRETLRAIKARALFYVFLQSDNNGVYIGENGHIFKQEYPLDEGSMERFAKKLNTLYETHLQGKNVYYAVIPDKALYSEAAKSHLHNDYYAKLKIVAAHIDAQIKPIAIDDCLALDDFYLTDLHWRQERIGPVLKRMGTAMGFSVQPEGEVFSYEPFYGAYYGQAAMGGAADTLLYLKNEYTEAAYVEDIQNTDVHSVYNEERLGGIDSYDVYLSGATPLVHITNPLVQNGKSLLLFRDSFGSSIAPMLLGAYEEITLVDLRYLSSDLLEEYVDFSVDDVLFLYGEQVLNNSAMLR